ncbi:MAG: hypothetical protein FWD38_04260 [Oscillospiraceae bacterium]|nr:hypothetical protein [Oscillospiraceae bacterium]
MLIFTLKKMLRNKWMVSCLLIGAIVFISVISMIPTYSNGVYQYMLIRDLEAQQIKNKDFPGNWFFTLFINYYTDDVSGAYARAEAMERRIKENYVPGMHMPVLATRKQYSLDRFFFNPQDTFIVKQVSILGIENFWEHADIISGRKPSNDTSNDVLEFVMSRTNFNNSDIRLDQEFDLFTYALPDDGDRQFGTAVCVGVYEPRIEEYFWFDTSGFVPPVFIIDYDYLVDRFVEPESIFVASVSFFYCFDYSALKIENVNDVLDITRRVRSEVHGIGGLDFQMASTLHAYNERRDVLEFMLWILIIPVIIMLIFYIYMVSKLMIQYESNEIAVLKSRGARNYNIFSVYALMSIFIAGISFFAGPPIGLLIGRFLGLTNGFMELVIRRGLPLTLTPAAYMYAAFAALWFILIMLVPALLAAGDSIVKSKQKKSRRISAPMWQKLCLDAVLIAVSLYALNIYRTNAELRDLADISGIGAPVDPLVLLGSSMFVLGCGLFFIRIFPFVIKLIFFAGKNYWPPTLYSSLLTISRFKGSSQFLTLFLVFNLGLGLFNATAARTLNRFLEDRINYEHGADITLAQTWPIDLVFYLVTVSDDGDITYTPTGNPNFRPPGPPSSDSSGSGSTIISRTNVKEPLFDNFLKLDGVKNATKVFKRNLISVSTGSRSVNSSIMGIIPHEFAEIAWFRNDLLPVHINNYLNLMTADPSAVLLSSEMRDTHGFKVGDHVRIGWREQSGNLDCTVYGFVDFWPSKNPVSEPNFVIANLNTIHRQMRVEPYSVWLSLEDGTTSLDFYESLNDAGIRVSRISDTRQSIIALRNDPLLQSLNGTLTLGFVVTLCITFIGFLIYWILSIRSRLLQFGILRAMGLSRTGLILTLIWEQLLVSGCAIAAGFGIGVLTSRLFAPALQLIYLSSEQIPPFLTVVNKSDYIVMISAFAGMLIAGLAILIIMIRRLKPDQVLKLGED